MGPRYSYGSQNLGITPPALSPVAKTGCLAEPSKQVTACVSFVPWMRQSGRLMTVPCSLLAGRAYTLALEDCTELFLTEVNRVVENGDAFFPEYSELFSPHETLHECTDFKLRRWERNQGS